MEIRGRATGSVGRGSGGRNSKNARIKGSRKGREEEKERRRREGCLRHRNRCGSQGCESKLRVLRPAKEP